MGRTSERSKSPTFSSPHFQRRCRRCLRRRRDCGPEASCDSHSTWSGRKSQWNGRGVGTKLVLWTKEDSDFGRNARSGNGKTPNIPVLVHMR
eukprot:scaffold602_cov298-Pinguiococcus_pyrenoidosus.AAC.7